MTEKQKGVAALTLTFEDGSQFKHTFSTPLSEYILDAPGILITLKGLGKDIQTFADHLVWQTATGLDLIPQLFPKLDKYLVWWRLEQESINLFRFLASDGTEIWMIEDEELPLLIGKTMERMADYEEAPHHE